MGEEIKTAVASQKEFFYNVGKLCKVPTILQMEAAECGAASLAMILAYHKRFVPLELLRVECGVSRDGSKANNILTAAKKYGFNVKAYKKEPEGLKALNGPMIIHWNFNHFVVFEGFKEGFAYLNDPAHGPRKVTLEEFDESFTGVVMTFEPGDGFTKGGEKPSIIKNLWKRFKGSETSLIYVVLAGLFLVIPGLLIPAFSKIFIDQIVLGNKLYWLPALLLGMAVTAVIRTFLVWIQGYYLLKMQNKISIKTTSQFLWHILSLPIEFFSQRYKGDILSRIQSNDTLADLLSGRLASTVISMFMLVFYLIIMIKYDFLLTFVGVVAIIINGIFMQYISKKRALENIVLLKDSGKLSAIAMGGLQTIETLKATASESDYFSKWAGYQANYMNMVQKQEVSNQYFSIFPSLILGLTDILVLIIGGYRVIDGIITIGTLVAFQSLMHSFMGPVNELVSMGSDIQQARGTIGRLNDILNYSVDKQVSNQNIDTENDLPTKLEGYIELRNVSFGYNKLESPLIEDFSLKLKPGSRVALVGGSGSGKSTVAKLVSGLYKPWTGEIIFDDKNMNSIPREILSNSIAFVDQDIAMFQGSLTDNITLWDFTISDEIVVKAAKDAAIHSDITEKNGAYDYEIEEGGRNFSGGQRQRIEIARALAIEPSILILDEATSSLDPKTEMIIDENIRKRGCTCLIIAHRLSTIRDCDEIIVMARGKIVQRGTHEEMINIDGPYKRLINMQ